MFSYSVQLDVHLVYNITELGKNPFIKIDNNFKKHNSSKPDCSEFAIVISYIFGGMLILRL